MDYTLNGADPLSMFSLLVVTELLRRTRDVGGLRRFAIIAQHCYRVASASSALGHRRLYLRNVTAMHLLACLR